MNKVRDNNTRAIARITSIIQWSCVIGLALIGIAVTCSFLFPLFSNAVITSRVVLGKLALINLCVLFAMFQSLLGVLLMLVGVTAPYEVQGESEGMKISIISSSPGIILVLLSTVLVWISLSNRFEVSSETVETDGWTTPAFQAEGIEGREKLNKEPQQSEPAPLDVKGPK